MRYDRSGLDGLTEGGGQIKLDHTTSDVQSNSSAVFNSDIYTGPGAICSAVSFIQTL